MRISILLLLLAIATNLSANNIVIQLGVFEKPVDSQTYFQDITNVKRLQDGSGFYLYYVEGIESKTEASKMVDAFNQMGYSARIINMDAVIACQNACSRPTSTTPIRDYQPSVEHYKVTEAFTPSEVSDYEKVRTVMINNPSTTVVLDGQATNLQCYLNMRGISNCRMIIKNDWSSVTQPVKVWVYDENNIALNIDAMFERIVG